MALNFPNTPTNAQAYVDPNGHPWVYEIVTNSWTSQGAPVAGMVYMGSINITTAPPTGATTGSVFTVSTGGTPNVGFIGLPTTVVQGAQVIYDGAKWQVMGSNSTAGAATNDATEAVKGIVELATAAETTTGTDKTRAVHPAGLKVELDKKANLASPSLTGVPKAPTAAAGTNTTQLATTAFVHVELGKKTQPTGISNVLINGALAINQRGVTIAAAAVGQYGPDRWKKVDATNMTQVVEDGNFEPGATYTLSGTGVTTQQLTAPATGNWTLPNIPIAATKIQLELGTVATPFERRHMGIELALCQRYYQTVWLGHLVENKGNVIHYQIGQFSTWMRATPTVTQLSLQGTNASYDQVNTNSVRMIAIANSSGYIEAHLALSAEL